jgi:peptidoglycan hydrolase CwlO-like protein
MSAPTIETDLGKILDQINQSLKENNQKLDGLQKDVSEIKIGQVRLEAELKGDIKALQGEVKALEVEVKGDIKALEVEVKGDIKALEAEVKGDIKTLQGEVSTLKEDIKDIKGSQKAQIWTLIGILGTAVVGTVIRSVITAMPAGEHFTP